MKIAVISDICGNLVALQAFFSEASKREVKHVLCAGNVIGYGCHPRECWELSQNRMLTTRGHMEHLIAHGSFPGPMSELQWQMLKFTFAQFTDKQRKAMQELPVRKYLKLNSNHVVVMGHSSLLDEPQGQRVNDTINIRSELDLLPQLYARANILILGNNTFPIFMSSTGTYVERNCDRYGQTFHLKANHNYMINPGSIGRPIDGEKPDAMGRMHFTFAIISIEPDDTSVTYYRTLYDPAEHIKAMKEKGLPSVFITQFTKKQ